jgi:fatty acid desaturase
MYQRPSDPNQQLASYHEEERQFAEAAKAERATGAPTDRRLAIVLFVLLLALTVLWIVRIFVFAHH